MNRGDREHIAQRTKVQMRDPEQRRIRSEGMRRAWQDPVRRFRMLRRLSEAHKKTWQDPEFKARMAQVHRELWEDSRYGEKMVKAQKEADHSAWPEASREKWRDPDYAAAVARGRKRRPTAPEQKLMSIIGENSLPFEYNGDSLGVTIGGLLPDFIDTNGGGAVIEVFGEYWHSPREMIEKEIRYDSVGYRCLFVWDFEICRMSVGEIVDMIRFHSNT